MAGTFFVHYENRSTLMALMYLTNTILALISPALFDHHLSLNALPQTGLRGKCPNRPKSDFLSVSQCK